MQAEIIAIGTELLLKEREDTNSGYIAEKLFALGIEVHYKTVVGDNQIDMENALKRALEKTDLVIATGGLGPTLDDFTKKVAARIFEKDLVLDKRVLERVEEHFRKRNLVMPKENVSQAYIIRGSYLLSNSRGTAPGFIIEKGEKSLVLLPGPPREMEPMLEEVIPFLEKKYKIRRFVESRILRTSGLPESALEEKIRDIIKERKNPTIGLTAHYGGVDIRIRARASTRKILERLLKETEEKISERLGDYIFGKGNQTLEEIIGYLLCLHKLTLAVAESCTGGLISHRLTNIPGSSDYYKRGVICYGNQSKVDFLGVPPETIREFGAVSSQTAQAMARGVRDLSRTNLGLGITGIAGPGGGTSQKPVGLIYIALSDGKNAECKEFKFLGNRKEVKNKSSQAALDLLRKYLIGI
jgi:nicotinamide-nucleotide amidase